MLQARQLNALAPPMGDISTTELHCTNRLAMLRLAAPLLEAVHRTILWFSM
jgi:hypothetical protein